MEQNIHFGIDSLIGVRRFCIYSGLSVERRASDAIYRYPVLNDSGQRESEFEIDHEPQTIGISLEIQGIALHLSIYE